MRPYIWECIEGLIDRLCSHEISKFEAINEILFLISEMTKEELEIIKKNHGNYYDILNYIEEKR